MVKAGATVVAVGHGDGRVVVREGSTVSERFGVVVVVVVVSVMVELSEEANMNYTLTPLTSIAPPP